MARLHMLCALWLATATIAGPSLADTASAGGRAQGASPQKVVARIGREELTEAQVIAQDQKDFDVLQENIELRQRQLQQQLAQSRYTLLQKQVDRTLDRKALELEAKARGVSPDAVLAEVKVPAVTEGEERAYFEANRARAGSRTFEQLQEVIAQFLTNQHNNQAMRSFYDALRAKHAIVSLLDPYRVAVAATGPARGGTHAAVTIVEFGDFQCPFCRQEEATLQTVLKAHPDDVRLVFRELPLASLHPNALAAAHAAVCADQQGKFWPMHDAMYQDQSALGSSALLDTAKRLGLDGDRFAACVSSEQSDKLVEQDTKAADELNINETPYFLINGRPLAGVVPADQFEAVISDELHRAGNQHG
jgi:protein-disulfide isomerase